MTGAYSFYDNDTEYGDTYGYIYNWFAISDSRGIAPEGWHVPTDEEWKELEMFLGMSQSTADDTGLRGTDEGGQLKTNGTSHWKSPNTGATNGSGFSALGSGNRDNNGFHGSMGKITTFWSSDEENVTHAWERCLIYNNAGVSRHNYFKQGGFSIRCIK